MKLEFYTAVRHKLHLFFKWRRYKHTESPSTLNIRHRSKMSCKLQRRERQGIRGPNTAGVGHFTNLQKHQSGTEEESEPAGEILLGDIVKPQWARSGSGFETGNRRTSSRERLVATGPQEGRGCKCESWGSGRRCYQEVGNVLEKLNRTRSPSRKRLISWVSKDVCPSCTRN